MKHRHQKQKTAAALLLTLLISILLPAAAYSTGTQNKVVRVGWFDSTYNHFDKAGRRSGYAYEYQLKLSTYNGWTYEYVEGNWPELLQMLKAGEIDLMSDVSRTEEREAFMSFPNYPMGAEDYYLFVAPGHEQVSPGDPSALNGKRIGVNQGSFQKDLFESWAARNNVRPEIVELSCSEEESLRMIESGELAAYVTVDAFVDPNRAMPVYKIGSSDYYFAVNKNRPDLLEDLNMALGRIQDENRYYNLQLYEKYMRITGANVFLSSNETGWLADHGPIRVGYQDNHMAFCAADAETGELTGVLKDYLEIASDCMHNAHIDFDATAYPTAEDAMTALKNGELDCVFPANLSGFEAEAKNLVMSPPLMDTEMYAVVRMRDPNIFAKKDQIIAAVNEGNPNYDAFLAEHFPEWGKAYFKDTEACLKAVSEGKADGLLISNYRYSNIARSCKKYRLTSISIGVVMDYCFAIKNGQTELYSILAKTAGKVPGSAIDAALTHYITEDAKLTAADYLADNLPLVLLVTSAVLLVILVLLVLNMRAAKRAKALILATEIDDLTGLYTRKYFFQYANRIHHEHPNRPMDAIVVNIEQFHSINALHGRSTGDLVLQTLGNEINRISKENDGIAGRFEADRFDIYCSHTDDYRGIFDRLHKKLDGLIPQANIRLRMGVMPQSGNLDPEQLFDRARTACNMARGHYSEHLIIYDETISKRESYEQRLISELRHALDVHEFIVYYQPKFSIRSETAQFVGAEALVRWKHPELGLLPPGDYIPLFEKNGQIRLLDQYVWSEAAKQIAVWREKYGITIPVSVNLSRVDVSDPELEDVLDNILGSNALDYGAFKLEVTESAYTENSDQVIRVIESLRTKGYEVEMDDFGTGYSSLSMLSAMPIDVLKMDREFVRNIEYNEKDIQLVALILDIARNLKVPVIAEGVETEEQLRMLKKLGCEQVQGYYFSRPLPSDEFEKEFLAGGENGLRK